ncbi:polyprenyl synthetase family protein [Streptomyces mirabilis]|uniref:polyprenyl synthetase family protein n=1 Tax=Streptomyces mirabilis TaxID=68239 RepID=UPI0036A775B5
MLVPAPANADHLASNIHKGLAMVKEVIHQAVDSDQTSLSAAARHLTSAGGKLFRPRLTLLAAQFGDHSRYEVVQAAAAIELVHLATLHHDDVMDHAPLRRGVPSVNALWGNRMAVQSGNFLMARASQLLAALGPDAVRAHAGLMGSLIEGQALELRGPSSAEDAIRHHYRVVEGKTSSLTSAAARLGALLSGAPQPMVTTLSEFGKQIGTVFQLADDLLDIEGKIAESGKLAGSDLQMGVPTLTTLLIESTPAAPDDPDDARLRHLLAHGLVPGDKLTETITLMGQHPAFAEARARTLSRAEDARTLLTGLPQNAARSALESLCQDAAIRVA